MKDLEEEDGLYHGANKLIRVLAQFSLGKEENLDQAYLRLVEKLHDEKILGFNDVLLSRAWAKDLQMLGFKWPSIVQRHSPFTTPSAGVVDQRKFNPDTVVQRHPPFTPPGIVHPLKFELGAMAAGSLGEDKKMANTSAARSSVRSAGILSSESSVAICLRGLVKDTPCSDNIIKNIVTPLLADIFLVLTPRQGDETHATESLKPFFQYRTGPKGIHFNNDSNDAHVAAALVVRDIVADGLNIKALGDLRTANALAPLGFRGRCLFQYRDMKSCGMLIDKEEKRRGARYDWVVISRNDLFWLREGPRLENLQGKRAVYVPCDKEKGGGCYRDWGGVNDGHFIIPRENAGTFFGLWDAISHNSPLLKILGKTRNKNIESFIFQALRYQQNVPLMRYAPGYIKTCSNRKIDNTITRPKASDTCQTCKFQNLSFPCRYSTDLEKNFGSSWIDGYLKMRFFKDPGGR